MDEFAFSSILKNLKVENECNPESDIMKHNEVDIETQEDMDITIKSEPDNYKSCSVKLEHITGGFLTILENIKVDTNTHEDVDTPIKSEMEYFKPCFVMLERLSDTFITTGKHIKNNKRKLNCPSLLGQVQGGGRCIKHGGTRSKVTCNAEGCSKWALTGGRCMRHGGSTISRKCNEEGCSKQAQGGVDSPRAEHNHHPSSPLRTKTELSQEVNRKLTSTKRVDRRSSCCVCSPPLSCCAFKEILVLSGDDTTMGQHKDIKGLTLTVSVSQTIASQRRRKNPATGDHGVLGMGSATTPPRRIFIEFISLEATDIYWNFLFHAK
uniref:Uncharacterized protein n=1 Tax=Timema shepardi TaxID=629360 RepID=A0A7R9G4X0_TIMSH|nr:unnamed protein product [Timema shepardi]